MSNTFCDLAAMVAAVKGGVLRVDGDLIADYAILLPGVTINARSINAGTSTPGTSTLGTSALGTSAPGTSMSGTSLPGDITYHAVAVAYERFCCSSIRGRRNNSRHFCLDREVEIREKPCP